MRQRQKHIDKFYNAPLNILIYLNETYQAFTIFLLFSRKNNVKTSPNDSLIKQNIVGDDSYKAEKLFFVIVHIHT